jgi:hypothetical protein
MRSLMMISWWSKHVGVLLSVLMCDIWINVLLHTGALVGPLYIVNWNARWNSEICFPVLFLVVVRFCLVCLEIMVRAHPFGALAALPVCPSVLSCWANRTPSNPSSSTFIHSCRGSCLRGTSTALKALQVCMLTFPLSAFHLICGLNHFFSQEKQIQTSLIALLLLQVGLLQHPQYQWIYTINSIQIGE